MVGINPKIGVALVKMDHVIRLRIPPAMAADGAIINAPYHFAVFFAFVFQA
jgi:hypothetical protein